MTDFETMKAMLERAGIEYKAEPLKLTVERGYPGFVSVITFHDDGSLASIEAYE